MNKDRIEFFKKIRMSDIDNRLEEDKWILDFFDDPKNKDMGRTAEEMGLKDEDFLNEDYQMDVDESELDDLEKFNFFPTDDTDEDDLEVVYKYILPNPKPGYNTKGISAKTRPFCRKLLTRDRVLDMKEIVALNNAPGKADRAGGGGYSVFKYRGGNNCNHIWKRYLYNKKEKELVKPDFIQPDQPSLR